MILVKGQGHLSLQYLHIMGGRCLPPNPPVVALKGGEPPPLTLRPLLQEVNAKKPLAASQGGRHGRPWETCELALAAWRLHLTMRMS